MTSVIVLLIVATSLSDHQHDNDGQICNHCMLCPIEEVKEPQCLPDPFLRLLKKMLFMRKIPGRSKEGYDSDCKFSNGFIPVFPIPPNVRISNDGILPYDCGVGQKEAFNGPPESPLHGYHKELPTFIIPLSLQGQLQPTHYIPVFPKFGRKFERKKRMWKRKREFENNDDDDTSNLTEEEREGGKSYRWNERCDQYRTEDWQHEFDEDQERDWSTDYDQQNERRLKKEKPAWCQQYKSNHTKASDDDASNAWDGKCGRDKRSEYQDKKTKAWSQEKQHYKEEVDCNLETIETEGEEVEDEDCYTGLAPNMDNDLPKNKNLFDMYYLPVLPASSTPSPSPETAYSHIIKTREVQLPTTIDKSISCFLNTFSKIPINREQETDVVVGVSDKSSVFMRVNNVNKNGKTKFSVSLIPVVRNSNNQLAGSQILFPFKQDHLNGNLMFVFPMPKKSFDNSLSGFAPLFISKANAPVCGDNKLTEVEKKKKNYGLSRCCKDDEKPTCPEIENEEDLSIRLQAQLTLRLSLREVVLNIASLTEKLLQIAVETNKADRVTVLFACPEYSCSGGCPETSELRASMGCIDFETYGAPPRASTQDHTKSIIVIAVHSTVPGDVFQRIVDEVEAAASGQSSQLSGFQIDSLKFSNDAEDDDDDHHHHHKKKKVWCYIIVISIAIFAVSIAGLSIWCCCCRKRQAAPQSTTIHVIHSSPIAGKVVQDIPPEELRAMQKAAEIDNVPEAIMLATIPGLASPMGANAA